MNFKFCPKCGSRSLEFLEGKKFHCTECGLVYFHNVASAVGAMIFCGDELLLGVRAFDPSKGLLDFPGGFCDPGETLEEAIQREIIEELSFNCTDWQYAFSVANEYLYKGVLYNTTDAFFRIDVDEKPNFKAKDDVQAVEWRNWKELKLEELAFSSTRKAIQRLLSV